MKKTTLFIIGLVSLSFVNIASAGGLKKMIGTWAWKGFTIKVVDCKATEVCAKVVKGPKNVGLSMIRSKLTLKGKDYYGKIAHPETADIYNTKITLKDDNTWKLDGCTDKKVCATGEFKRVK